MTATAVGHPSGVDLTLRIPGMYPVTVRAATLADAVTCARSIVAEERRKVMQAFDAIDAALVALAVGPSVA